MATSINNEFLVVSNSVSVRFLQRCRLLNICDLSSSGIRYFHLSFFSFLAEKSLTKSGTHAPGIEVKPNRSVTLVQRPGTTISNSTPWYIVVTLFRLTLIKYLPMLLGASHVWLLFYFFSALADVARLPKQFKGFVWIFFE